MADPQIETLNQILAMVDEKATAYQNNLHDMPAVRAAAEKTLIFKLIDDALDLARRIDPKPYSTIQDLERLQKQLARAI